MKKIIALMLVIFTLAALFVSCGNDTETPNPIGTDNNGNEIPGFTAVNETVYATDTVNVRSTPAVTEEGEQTNVLGQLPAGKDILRTGINEETGWSRVMYNNEVAYINSRYLSLTKPDDTEDTEPAGTDVPDDQFTACNDETEIYTTVTDDDNNDVHQEGSDSAVYSAPNRSKNDGSLKDGTAVKRVAVYYEREDDHTYGWSKIEVTVDGKTKTYFIRNSQLKIEMVKEEATGATAANS